jgi:6-phosphogluconolactonase
MENSLTEACRFKVLVLPHSEALFHKAAAFTAEQTSEDIASRGKSVIALSGGSTPSALYSLLGDSPFKDRVDWPRVHFFWSDERCVPKEDQASNFRLAFDTLLSRVSVPEANIHRIKGEKEPSEGARDYEREMRKFFRTARFPNFDLILLGVGEDGHTASLFPGSEALAEKERPVLPVYVKRPGLNRITLSLPVLNHARHILFLVSGSSKAPIVCEILGEGGKKDKLPAGLVQPLNGRVTWLIDQEAASLLK